MSSWTATGQVLDRPGLARSGKVCAGPDGSGQIWTGLDSDFLTFFVHVGSKAKQFGKRQPNSTSVDLNKANKLCQTIENRFLHKSRAGLARTVNVRIGSQPETG